MQFPGLTFVVGKNKNVHDWLVVACGTEQERPDDLPFMLDGVEVEYTSAGPVRVPDQEAWSAVEDYVRELAEQGDIIFYAPHPEESFVVLFAPLDAIGVNYRKEVGEVKILLGWLPRPVAY